MKGKLSNLTVRWKQEYVGVPLEVDAVGVESAIEIEVAQPVAYLGGVQTLELQLIR
jgi:hypothetical protein